jgi:hypothetical protein
VHTCDHAKPVPLEAVIAKHASGWTAGSSVDTVWYMWDAVTAFAAVMGKKLPANARPSRKGFGSVAWLAALEEHLRGAV